MDFINAPTQQMGSGELIPKGTLAWGVINLKPHNFDQGMIAVPSKSDKGKAQGNAYLDCEVTIAEGRHKGRKVFEMIGVAGSEKYVQGGHAAVRHILEVGRGANPTSNPQGYVIGAGTPADSDTGYMELDGLKVAVKIGVDTGNAKSDGSRFPDKNRIDRFLSPNPASDTAADYARLVKGDTEPTEKEKAAATTAAPRAAAPSAPAKPAFLGTPPAAAAPAPQAPAPAPVVPPAPPAGTGAQAPW